MKGDYHIHMSNIYMYGSYREIIDIKCYTTSLMYFMCTPYEHSEAKVYVIIMAYALVKFLL